MFFCENEIFWNSYYFINIDNVCYSIMIQIIMIIIIQARYSHTIFIIFKDLLYYLKIKCDIPSYISKLFI